MFFEINDDSEARYLKIQLEKLSVLDIQNILQSHFNVSKINKDVL